MSLGLTVTPIYVSSVRHLTIQFMSEQRAELDVTKLLGAECKFLFKYTIFF